MKRKTLEYFSLLSGPHARKLVDYYDDNYFRRIIYLENKSLELMIKLQITINNISMKITGDNYSTKFDLYNFNLIKIFRKNKNLSIENVFSILTK